MRDKAIRATFPERETNAREDLAHQILIFSDNCKHVKSKKSDERVVGRTLSATIFSHLAIRDECSHIKSARNTPRLLRKEDPMNNAQPT